jgi:hypothetical protein
VARIEVEGWDPEYGTPLGDPLEASAAAVDPDVEVRAAEWRPLAPGAETRSARRVAFVDGVRRIDALVWITEPEHGVRRGICASYAAGVVRAGDRAELERAEVRRALFSPAPLELPTAAGAYLARTTAGDEIDALSLALQQRLGELEIEVATSFAGDVDLIVVDGPLSGRQNVPGAVGYVKTHRVRYLPDALAAVVAALRAGERTPLFATATSWTRFSWYQRLPGVARHPWAGVVRLEASADHTVEEAARLADRCAATLPRYASVPHKDPRAPQNLFPIGGLERELRRRLGDPAFVQRALRSAAASAV